jgi:hypothetical protein
MNTLPQPNKNPDIQLLERLVGNGNVVTVHTFMIDLTGDHVIAMFLEQLLYWRSRSADKNHEIAKSDADWYEEIRISERQMRRARAWLLAHKLTKVQRKRSKYYANQPVYHYTVNMDALQKAIIKTLGKPARAPKVTGGELHEPSSSKVDGSHGSQGDEPAASFTESTSETTPETTVAANAAASKRRGKKADKPIDPHAADKAALIDVWSKATHNIDKSVFGHKTTRTQAQSMIDAGVTPILLQDFLAELMRDDFWRRNPPKFSTTLQKIGAWMVGRQPRIVESDTAPVHTPSTLAPDTKVIGDMTAAEFDALTDAERQAQIDLKLASIAGRIVGTEGGKRGREAARNELDELNKSA